MAAITDTVPAIRTAGLHKRYGSHVALHGLDLLVRPGEVVGFLGPNGAGKTTTVKILAGLVRPTAGSASLFGIDVADPAARRRIGYLPELFRFPAWMTGEDVLAVHGRLAGLPADEGHVRAGGALERVGLHGRGGEKVGGYSKGMQQRLGLAQALLAGPDLVLLDEPTSALDPIGRREVREVIRDLGAGGTAVLLNSHLLGEVESVADRVVVVDRGRAVASGTLEDLVAGGPQVRVTVDRVDAALLTLLADLGDVLDVEDETVVLGVAKVETAAEVAAAVVGAGYRLLAMIPVATSLEDVFMGLVEGGDR